MSDNHHPPAPIKRHGKNTWALWADRPADTLVVFVHGYGGKSVETWFQFEGLLPHHGQGADFVFYGYEAFLNRIQSSATLFYRFLNKLASAPGTLVEGVEFGSDRPATWAYRKIVIVAHSMGAIVARRALLFALDAGESWPAYTRLVLFAPAHSGVDDAVRLALGMRDPLGLAATFSQGLKVASGALRDLLDTKTFERLEYDTKRWLTKDPTKSRCLIARQVVFGARENVVSQDRFCSDPHPPAYIERKDHLSVCKPSASFIDPVMIVAGEL